MTEKQIPYGHQDISQSDIDAVVQVLKSDWLTQGPTIDRFEKVVADYCGAKYAVAVSNATAALHIACLAAKLGPGDTLWTSPNTFVASSNCALYCGASVDFVDIDPETYNMSVTELEKKLAAAKRSGKLPKIVVPVHFGGASCEMEKIAALAKEYGFMVLEDASHAVGGKYRSKRAGSCEFSDMTVFSFHPVKIITTGEGGIVLTNDEKLYERLQVFRTHGITRKPELMTEPSHGGWYYQQIELGYNYRLTDLQAALGIEQMKRIDQFVKKRNSLAKRYQAAFEGLPVIWQKIPSDTLSAYHLFVIRLDLKRLRKKAHREFFDAMRADGIGVNLHYIPVHLQPYYKRLGFKKGQFPEAERYYEEAISLPMYSALTESDQDRVIKAVKAALG